MRNISMNENKRRDWRVICEEVLQETNPARLNILLEELLAALERREHFQTSPTSDMVRNRS
jgi:hypothetical protein